MSKRAGRIRKSNLIENGLRIFVGNTALALVLLTRCTSEHVRVSDGRVEAPIEEAAGVRSEQVTEAARKLTSTESPNALTLDDLYALSVDRTERLAIRQETVIQAEAKKSQAIGAWIPSLSYRETRNATIPDHAEKDREQRQRSQAAAIALGNPALWPSSSASSSSLPPNLGPGRKLVLHVPIFTGLNEVSGITGSNALIAQRRLELNHDASRLYLELAQAYYNVLLLEQSLRTKREVLDLSKQTTAQLERFVALGKVRRTDLLSARSSLARTEAEVESIRDSLARARDTLGSLAGVPAEVSIAPHAELAPPSVRREQAEQIADARADVEAARAGLDVSKAGLTAARGDFLPSFYIDGYYSLPRHNTPRNKDIFAQFTFQVPLFSGGSSVAGLKKAESEQRQAELILSQLRRQALLEIREAFDAWGASQTQIAAYKKALEAAELNYAAQSDYYNRRLGTILDLLNSLGTLAQARDEYSRAVLQEKLNRIWLGVAVGELPAKKARQNVTD
jgi:outer membrane protein